MPCAFDNDRVMNTPGNSIASGAAVLMEVSCA